MRLGLALKNEINFTKTQRPQILFCGLCVFYFKMLWRNYKILKNML